MAGWAKHAPRPKHETKIVKVGYHFRWICSCGSKGNHLFYRGHVKELAETHEKKNN